MTARRYSAWQFSLPGFDSSASVPGIGTSPTGGIEMIDGAASVRQSILLLLSTRLGERIMRPDYGTELGTLVFAPNDDTTAGLAIHYVRRALQRWEPRIDVLRVDAGRNPGLEWHLDVVLDYRVRLTQRSERLTFSMSLAGEP